LSGLISLALVLGTATAFILSGGSDKVSGFFNSQVQKAKGENEIDSTTPKPIDEGNVLPNPQDIQNIKDMPPARETVPKNKLDFKIPTINGEMEGPPSPFNTPKPPINSRTSKPIPTPKIQENYNVQTGIKGKSFKGGGPDFSGGTIRETPVTKNSTLSFIIKRFGVSASKAASIKAGLSGGLEKVDFGTNTGSGQIGHTPEATKLTRKERMEIAAQNAQKIFNSENITNFRGAAS